MSDKVLVVAPSWIGDTLLAQPLLSHLMQMQPGRRIDVLAPAWSAPLFERMDEVSEIIANPFAHGELRLAARRTLGRSLHERGYAQAYVLPNSWKSALVPFFARIPVRIGYHGEARWGLLTRRHRLDTQGHPQLMQRYRALAQAPGDNMPLTLRPPHLDSSPAQQAAARAALGLPGAVAPIVFCPGAEYGPAKRWPSAHFAQLARLLTQPARETFGGTAPLAPPTPFPVWIVGSAKDFAGGEEIARLAGGAALNLCGRTTLEQVIDLIAGARAVVSNDSGLMHVAAALQRPLVALYGSSSPAYTPPCSALARIVSRNLPCSPCFARECPLGHLDCLRGIEPMQVMAQLRELERHTLPARLA